MNRRVLIVDDEQHLLDGVRRTLRKECELTLANGPESGLEAIRGAEEPFAAIISDMRMPGMNGIEFLVEARRLTPDSVRMMLTGNADQGTAMEAVNTGEVFRFLTKPVEPDTLRQVVALAIRQHELVVAEKELLERTVRGSVRALAELLAITSPDAFGRVDRVRKLASEVGAHFSDLEPWVMDTAALLSQIGCVGLDGETVRRAVRGESLPSTEELAFLQHPLAGAELIAAIPRLEPVADIVRYQHKHFDGSGVPRDALAADAIPLGSRILHTVLAYDILMARKLTEAEAVDELARRDRHHDPAVVRALAACLHRSEHQIETLRVQPAQLKDGMVVQMDVVCDDGLLLVCRGQTVSPAVRRHLSRFHESGRLSTPVLVTPVPDPDA